MIVMRDDARAAARPQADPSLGALLERLGPPDADGLRPLAVSGRF